MKQNGKRKNFWHSICRTMVTNIKRENMKRIIIMAICSLMVLGTASYSAKGQDFVTLHYIEVSGKAHKEVTPDKIYLNITINEKDYKNTSLEAIEKKMISQLQNMGIDTRENLMVRDMSSNFKHYFILKSDVKLMKQYTLLTTSAKQAGEVIMALDQLAISEVAIDRVECSKMDQYKDEVRVQAIKNAKARAELLAGAINHSVGKAIHISETDHNHRVYGMPNMMMVRGAVAEDQVVRAPEIEFEKIKIEITAHVKFELK